MTSNIKYLVVHHTAVSYDKNPDQWNQTNTYHKEKFNMLSQLGYYVGYNYEINRAGVVRQARYDGEETAAVIGHNKDSISICLDGNFDIEYPTRAQISALETLLREKMTLYSIPLENIVLHRHFAPYKSCAGKLLKDDWARMLVTPPLQKVIINIKKLFMTESEELHAMDGKARNYEVKNKSTGDVHQGVAYELGNDGFTVVLEDGAKITFSGDYDNGEYLVRDVESHTAPDGITQVTF